MDWQGVVRELLACNHEVQVGPIVEVLQKLAEVVLLRFVELLQGSIRLLLEQVCHT